MKMCFVALASRSLPSFWGVNWKNCVSYHQILVVCEAIAKLLINILSSFSDCFPELHLSNHLPAPSLVATFHILQFSFDHEPTLISPFVFQRERTSQRNNLSYWEPKKVNLSAIILS